MSSGPRDPEARAPRPDRRDWPKTTMVAPGRFSGELALEGLLLAHPGHVSVGRTADIGARSAAGLITVWMMISTDDDRPLLDRIA